MPSRNRIQFQPWLSVMLLLAIGVFGWREPSGEAPKSDSTTLCKAGAIFTTLQGRDARSAARKTPTPSVPLVNFQPGNAFDFGGFVASAPVAESPGWVGEVWLAGQIRERAPPALA